MTGIGIYLRLSLSDEDLGKNSKDESNSIENQRTLLREFIESREEFDGEVFEYVDDGYSGTNFNRPAFKRMIEDAKTGKIKTIITKDLSRFGRDYIGVGDYLEQIFPSLGIRFIAVNSNYDSNNYIGNTLGLDTSISNLINTMYSKDLSKKIKSAYQTRWKKGISTATIPPYGYMRGEKKTDWVIDPDAAKIVRRIFKLASDGKKTSYIAEYLNKKKTMTPAVYCKEKYYELANIYSVVCKEPLWDTSIVRRIVKNYEYTGAMVHGNYINMSIGTRKMKKAPEQDLLIVENVHPAIVSKEQYEKAQMIFPVMKKRAMTIDHKNILGGMIRCGNCNLIMAYSPQSDNIYCAHKTKVGSQSTCSNEKYEAKIIEGLVTKAIKTQLSLLFSLRNEIADDKEKEFKEYDKTVKKLKSDIEYLKDEKLRSYESFATGKTKKEAYISLKEDIDRQLNNFQEKLYSLTSSKEDSDELVFEINRLQTKTDSFVSGKPLTREMAVALIEGIVLFDREHMDIKFKFEDMLERAFDICYMK